MATVEMKLGLDSYSLLVVTVDGYGWVTLLGHVNSHDMFPQTDS